MSQIGMQDFSIHIWHWLPLFFAFVIGGVTGSFIGVVTRRLPVMMGQSEHPKELEGQNTTEKLTLAYPRSHCAECKKPLRLHHNIPLISYVFLKGFCAYCKKPIGFWSFAIELLCALWWSLCYIQNGLCATSLVFALYGSALLCLAFIDWQTQLLPDAITQPLLWGGLIASALGLSSVPLTVSLWGAVLGYLVLWTVSRSYYILRGHLGMGDGDLKLVGALGAWMGPIPLIALILLACVSGILGALILRLKGRMKAGDYIPFGPFLVFSALLIHTYLNKSAYPYTDLLSQLSKLSN